MRKGIEETAAIANTIIDSHTENNPRHGNIRAESQSILHIAKQLSEKTDAELEDSKVWFKILLMKTQTICSRTKRGFPKNLRDQLAAFEKKE